MEIMNKGLTAKKNEDSWANNTPNTLKFILPISPIGPKIWDIVEKRFHWASVVCG